MEREDTTKNNEDQYQEQSSDGEHEFHNHSNVIEVYHEMSLLSTFDVSVWVDKRSSTRYHLIEVSVMAITAQEVKYIRNKIGCSVLNFATLLGVSIGTVYRWERTDKNQDLRIEMMQASILTLIDQMPLTKEQAAEIEAAIIVGGMIEGLYVLLRIHHERSARFARNDRDPSSSPRIRRRALPAHNEGLTSGEDNDR